MFEWLHDFLGYEIRCVKDEQDNSPCVQVFKVRQTVNSTKFWIRRDGVELAHNKGRIPLKDLRKIESYLLANQDTILAAWYRVFNM